MHQPSLAAERNRQPILGVLEAVLPDAAAVLEVASGAGQHAAHAAAAHPRWTWQPSELDPLAGPAIDAATAGLANVRPALRLDVTEWPWPEAIGRVDAICCVNLLHASPWATCPGLLRGAAAHLVPGGVLVLYGPYRVEGEALAASNAAFDADLRARDASWGLRSLHDVTAAADAAGLRFDRRWDLPSNNLALAFRQPRDAVGHR